MSRSSKNFSIKLGEVKIRKSTPSNLRGTHVHDERGHADRRATRELEREALQEAQEEALAQDEDFGPDL